MNGLFLLVLLILGTPLVLSIAAFVRGSGVRSRLDDIDHRIRALERERRSERRTADVPPPQPIAPPVPPATPRQPVEFRPPPLPEPRSVPAPAAPTIRTQPPQAVAPEIDWEQFMGAKLFAWLGGLALFLGVAFFVKYSFEHNLIPPVVRVAIGFLTGIGLIVAGLKTQRPTLAVLSQTLCATGVVILYAVTFACRAYYHFSWFQPAPTFAIMSLVTALAFTLAVRKNAQVVAVLGILGGFLTPLLLSTGEDNPAGLFGYLALLNVGLIAVALRRRWDYLVALGAVGTVLMETTWLASFSHHYLANARHQGVPMTVFGGFVLLFLLGTAGARRRGEVTHLFSGSVLMLAAAALGLAAALLGCPGVAQHPALLFGFVFLIDAAVLTLVWWQPRIALAQPLTGIAVFALLAAWTSHALTPGLLYPALGWFLVFAVFHAVAPLVLHRFGRGGLSTRWGNVFPLAALLLMLLPALAPGSAWGSWLFVLLLDALAIGMALLSATLLPVLVALGLTLFLLGTGLNAVPDTLTGLPTLLFLLGGFSVLFLAASMVIARRASSPTSDALQDPWAPLLPACSAALPFGLLILVCVRLPLADPSPVFGLALLLVAMLLATWRLLKQEALPLVTVLAVTALEYAWHAARFQPGTGVVSIAWYLGFYAVFVVFPFFFTRASGKNTLPWAASAAAGPLVFPLLLRATGDVWPAMPPGVVPAFMAVVSLGALGWLVKSDPGAARRAEGRAAWWGAVALFFLTVTLPVQWDREWITLGWALEGAALCWLFRHVPHSGLRLTGVALLVTAFVRLSLNPAVLGYHVRGETPLLNWYLYAYGVVTLCLFAGARLLAPPRHEVLGRNAPAWLTALGTALAFVLLNLEIADFFTPVGAAVVTLNFGGTLGRDMTYSMAWSLFALGLMGIGIARRKAPARYAGLALLSVTLLKLFFHDLSQLGQLYRIGALVVVAITAIAASFLYQRFLSPEEKPPGT